MPSPRKFGPHAAPPLGGAARGPDIIQIFLDLEVDIVYVRTPDPCLPQESSDPTLRPLGAQCGVQIFSDLAVDIVHVQIHQFLAPFLGLRMMYLESLYVPACQEAEPPATL